MKKILVDFHVPKTREYVQEYLASMFGFPDCYGKNLDALYDMLTDIQEDTCVGIFQPENEKEGEEMQRYMNLVKEVFRDAEQDNSHLCVIFGKMEDNYPESRDREVRMTEE